MPLSLSLHQGRPAALTPSETQADVAWELQTQRQDNRTVAAVLQHEGFQWAIRRTHEPAKLVASHTGPYDDEAMGRSM